jgi:hypothetical protein
MWHSIVEDVIFAIEADLLVSSGSPKIGEMFAHQRGMLVWRGCRGHYGAGEGRVVGELR